MPKTLFRGHVNHPIKAPRQVILLKLDAPTEGFLMVQLGQLLSVRSSTSDEQFRSICGWPSGLFFIWGPQMMKVILGLYVY